MRVQVVPDSVRPMINDVQQSTWKMLPYWSAAAITAVFSVIFAKAFVWSEDLAFRWHSEHPAWAFVLTPLTMVLSALMAHFFAPTAAGSGIPQLLAAVEGSREPMPIVQKLLSGRMIVVKFFGSCVCVAGGGVTGREGPMLQIAAGLFYYVRGLWPRVFRGSPAPGLQSMILAGGAAGLASAFNTPLGGVIFAIEELAKVHISHIRTYVFHAVIIAGILAQAILGNYIYLGRIQAVAIKTEEVVPLVLGMAVIGILGALFGRAVVWVLDLRSRLDLRTRIAMTVGLGLIVAGLSFYFGADAIGSGRAVILRTLTQESGTPFYLGALRGLSNLFTYAGGVVGGIFAPALSTGAAFGGWFSEISPGFNHQLWALAGMAAFLTGVTRTPFTSLILVLEMTDTHDIIIYLMLAAIIAQGASRFVDPIGFYEHMAHRILHGKPPEKSAH